jgi:hypothetical protein
MANSLVPSLLPSSATTISPSIFESSRTFLVIKMAFLILDFSLYAGIITETRHFEAVLPHIPQV